MRAEFVDEGISQIRVSSPHFCIMPAAALEITSPHLCIMPAAAVEMYREPLMNIANAAEAFVITVEMPGVSRENVEVILNGRLLEIEGTRKVPKGDTDYTHQETVSRLFYRWLELPDEVDPDRVQVEAANGVVVVSLPKKTASKTVRVGAR